jgi:calcineurin-like phosphoesterase family protein
MIYFTSDHHFTDNRLNLFPRYFDSVDQMGDHMIEMWNKTVKPSDEVYYLGDFSYMEEGIKIAEKLNGTKHLILGNHDDKFDTSLFEPYFESIQTTLDLQLSDGDDKLDVHLVHYPSKGVADRFNLVGHIHGTWRLQKNMLNVGVDAWHFKPLSEKEVIFFYNAICNHYDRDVWVSSIPANVKHNDRGKNYPKSDLTLKSLIKDLYA